MTAEEKRTLEGQTRQRIAKYAAKQRFAMAIGEAVGAILIFSFAVLLFVIL